MIGTNPTTNTTRSRVVLETRGPARVRTADLLRNTSKNVFELNMATAWLARDERSEEDQRITHEVEMLRHDGQHEAGQGYYLQRSDGKYAGDFGIWTEAIEDFGLDYLTGLKWYIEYYESPDDTAYDAYSCYAEVDFDEFNEKFMRGKHTHDVGLFDG